MDKKIDNKRIKKIEEVKVWESPYYLCETSIMDIYISKMVKQGNKTKSEQYFFKLLGDLVQRRRELNILYDKSVGNLVNMLEVVVQNVRPLTVLIVIKKGGKRYNVAVGLREEKSLNFGIDWVVREPSRKFRRTSNKFYPLLLKSVVDSYKGQGIAVNKRDVLYEEALSSRVYLKFL